MRSRKILTGIFIVCLLAGSIAAAPAARPAQAQAPAGWQVVASGLNNPRGLAFADDGTLLIAEAGFGGNGLCVPGPEGGEVCLGNSGSVTRLQNGVQERFITGLPSLADPSGMAATGPHDVIAKGRNVDVLIGLGADPAARAQFGLAGACLGHLVRASWTGAYTCYEDISGFEASANPDDGEFDSNPYSMDLIEPGKRVIADAGGNSLLVMFANGQVEELAVFPDTLVLAPPFLGLPPGAMMPMQAVPNAVAIGPDGAIYVGQLTGFPFPIGGASVFKVVPGQDPQVFASGFTNIIDLTFDSAGNLYVLEIAANSLLSGDVTGALIMVAPDGTQTELASAGLVAPGGVAIGPDGGIYVSNFGIFPGAGQVVRIAAGAAGPLPSGGVAHALQGARSMMRSIPQPGAEFLAAPEATLKVFLPMVNQ